MAELQPEHLAAAVSCLASLVRSISSVVYSRHPETETTLQVYSLIEEAIKKNTPLAPGSALIANEHPPSDLIH